MPRSKTTDQPKSERAAEDQPKQRYFFPNLDPDLPPVSVEAADQEEAEQLYQERLKQHEKEQT